MVKITKSRKGGPARSSGPTADKPQHLLRVWEAVAQRVRQADRIVLFTDFDGTLTPIRRMPGAVCLSAAVRELLAKMARNGITVGVVSGRRVRDVRARVGLSGIWYIGVHGYEIYYPDNRTELFAHADHRRQIQLATRQLIQLRKVPGLSLDDKEATVAVHYRRASSQNRHLAWTTIQSVLAKYPNLHLLSGKKVWELLPDSRTSKWTAIQFVLRSERSRYRGHSLVFYLGDDTTDERVFEKMRGITVAVGKHQRTAARFFLYSPAEVRRFLQKLGDFATAKSLGRSATGGNGEGRLSRMKVTLDSARMK
ncbi:MAG: trehalose-phosphatase [Acidobacteria bacterium]|nr:trehalose-phosphatase [Acidobacteriota bacterium]